MHEHYGLYGEWSGVRSARKHIGWYVAALPGGEELRQAINRVEQAEQQWQQVDAWFARLEQQQEFLTPVNRAFGPVENWRQAA